MNYIYCDKKKIITKTVAHYYMATMTLYPLYLLLALVPSLHTLPASRQAEAVTGPANTTAAAGSSARLECGLGSPGQACSWTKDGWLLEAGGRHDLAGCSLAISPVLALDQGEYRCQVPGRLSRPAHLRVLVEPGRPALAAADTVTAARGEQLQLSCSSAGARPAADIQWWSADTGEQIVAEVASSVTRRGDSFTTSSTLKMKVQEPMKIYCTAHSEAFPTLKQSEPVEVSIRGEPRLETIGLRQGDSVKVFCHNRLVEDVLKFRWLINGREIPGESRDVLEITDFTPAHDGSVVKCAVTDARGAEETVRAVQLSLSKEARRPRVVPSTFSQLLDSKTQKKAEVMMNDDIVIEEDSGQDDATSATNKKSKTTFICVVEEDTEATGEPKYVWVNGKLTAKRNEDASADRKYKCKVIRNGYKRINKIARDLKSYSKSIKKMTKYLENISHIVN